MADSIRSEGRADSSNIAPTGGGEGIREGCGHALLALLLRHSKLSWDASDEEEHFSSITSEDLQLFGLSSAQCFGFLGQLEGREIPPWRRFRKLANPLVCLHGLPPAQGRSR